MTTRSIEERLHRIEVSTIDDARTEAGETVASLVASTSAAGRPARRPRLVAIAAAVAIAAVLVAATPQGRSAASAAARLVGIGDEPSQPFSFSALGDSREASNVIAVGESPNGTPFELATTTSYEQGQEPNGTTCIYLSYPTLEKAGSHATCLTAAALRAIHRSYLDPFGAIGPAGLGSDSDLLVSGSAAPRVRSIEITYADEAGDEHTVTPVIGDLVAGNSGHPHSIAAKPGGQRVRAFVGFLPSTLFGEVSSTPRAKAKNAPFFATDLDVKHADQVLDRISVTAYGSAGEVIAGQTLGDNPNAGLAIVFGLRERLRHGKPPDQ
jgi:hypothetical protein